MSKGAEFRELMDQKDIVVRPSVHDALTAKVAEKAGFESTSVSGYGTSLSRLGLPDFGYLTLTEMVDHARHVAYAVGIPVFADFDTGYGNALNVRRAVREAITTTRLAGVMIEDQYAPKRCGHIAGKQLISREEAVGKYRAACDVRDEFDEDFLLVARTDALGATDGSIDEAIERANLYAETGADIVFVEAPTSEEQVRRIGLEVDATLLYSNMVSESSISPIVEHDRLSEIGFDIVAYLASPVPTVTSVYDYLTGLRENGPDHEREFTERVADHPYSDLHKFAEFDAERELEKEYLPEEEQEKYESSEGFEP